MAAACMWLAGPQLGDIYSVTSSCADSLRAVHASKANGNGPCTQLHMANTLQFMNPCVDTLITALHGCFIHWQRSDTTAVISATTDIWREGPWRLRYGWCMIVTLLYFTLL